MIDWIEWDALYKHILMTAHPNGLNRRVVRQSRILLFVVWRHHYIWLTSILLDHSLIFPLTLLPVFCFHFFARFIKLLNYWNNLMYSDMLRRDWSWELKTQLRCCCLCNPLDWYQVWPSWRGMHSHLTTVQCIINDHIFLFFHPLVKARFDVKRWPKLAYHLLTISNRLQDYWHTHTHLVNLNIYHIPLANLHFSSKVVWFYLNFI